MLQPQPCTNTLTIPSLGKAPHISSYACEPCGLVHLGMAAASSPQFACMCTQQIYCTATVYRHLGHRLQPSQPQFARQHPGRCSEQRPALQRGWGSTRSHTLVAETVKLPISSTPLPAPHPNYQHLPQLCAHVRTPHHKSGRIL